MDNKTIRVGIFGLTRGRAFARSLQIIEGVKVTAVCEKSQEVFDKAKEYLDDDVLYFKDFAPFIETKLDAVIIANNFHEHVPYAIEAFKRGIAVMSETTAAPTLGECVELCRAAEKYNGRYMLGANTSFMPGPTELKRLVQSGAIGDVLFGQAEYQHTADTEPTGFIDKDPSHYTHWRKYLPRTYYNMHSLGTMMEITGAVPVRVSGKSVFAPKYAKLRAQPYNGDTSALTLAEMSNGATFATTGVVSFGPTAKWFRLSGVKGNAETLRFDETGVRVDCLKYAVPEELKDECSKIYYPENAGKTDLFTDKERSYEATIARASSTHYGCCDLWLTLFFLKFVRGEVKPFFDVYKACALSAAAILSWRSVLNDGKSYEIPDFSDENARKIYENDYASPFPKADGTKEVPTSSQKYNLFENEDV